MLGQTAGNMPSSLTTLIGRERDISETLDLVLREPGRLVTLTGVGGCGKTRLALQVATDLRESFPDGVWMVELAPVSDPLLVPQAVSAALGLAEIPDEGSIDLLVASLQARTLLIILDNCEHLVDACATLASNLLSACPELRILATSREPLQIAGERQRRVHPLEAPDSLAIRSLDELARYPAVQLFVERASAVESGFRLTPENALSVAQICARLDGIPLALELAAVRIRVLSPEQILQRLDDTFRLLTGNSRSAPTRQQTLKAALDWSYNLLSLDEQKLFRRLSVFALGWSLEAAEAVCAGDGVEGAEVLDVLTRLVDKSLVLVERKRGETYYRLLEPVREYGRLWLAVSGEADGAMGRLAEWHINLAEQAEPELQGPAQGEWLRRLDRELDNIRAALSWAVEHGEADTLLRLTGNLYWYFWMSRHLREGLHWLETALAKGAAAPPKHRAKGLLGTAMMLWMLGECQKGRMLGQEALEIYLESNDLDGLAMATIMLSMETLSCGDVPKARALAEEGINLARQTGSLWQLGHALMGLGQVFYQQGDTARAIALHEEAIAALQKHGDKIAAGFAEQALASLERDRVDLARPAALSAIRQHWEHGDHLSLAGALEYFAMLGGFRNLDAPVRLIAAAHTLRLSLGTPLPIVERDDIDRCLAAAQANLGNARFAEAWADGCAMSLEQAVSGALNWSQASAKPLAQASPARNPGPSNLLTRREMEVAKLIAQGHTDRQIAEKLTITEGTAGVHVHHILEKLSFRSRFQIVDWALAQGLIDERPD